MTVTCMDLFAGAGGSSVGAEAAGMTPTVAANHWPVATETYAANHPDVRVDTADISQTDPRRYPTTDVLIASPECTNHSQAKGTSRKRQDPSLFDSADLSAERSRATMWDVPRFAEQIDFKAIIVENVVEAVKWVGWRGWCQVMDDIGYHRQTLSLNAMFHGVAQSRDRLFVVFTPKTVAPPDFEITRDAWCPNCERINPCHRAWKNGRTVGKYRSQWIWQCVECRVTCEPDTRAAEEIIDWSLPCPRIGDRDVPLVPKTLARIEAGLWRHYPFLFNTAHGGRISDIDRPHPTVCASDDRQSLIVPLRNNGRSHPTTDPLGTVTAGGNHHGLLMRNNTGGAEMVTPVTEPARTMTTTGHQSLLLPYYGQSQAVRVDQPIGTQTTRDTHALVNAASVVDDCGFRMLEPYEVAAAQAFPEGYISRDLSKKHQVKLAGNAVAPPQMEWVAGRVVKWLEAA